MIHFRIRYEQLRATLGERRRREAVLRATWLGLSVIGLAAPAWAAGWLGPWPMLWPLTAVAVFLGAVAWLARPQAPAELGEALDRRFELDDLLVTAIEVDSRGPAGPLEVRLLDDAATALARIERDPRLRGPGLALEAEALAGVAAVVAGAWFLAIALGGAALGEALPEIGFGGADTGLQAAGGVGTDYVDQVGSAFLAPLGGDGTDRASGGGESNSPSGLSSGGLDPSGDLRIGTPAARLDSAALATMPPIGGDGGSGVAAANATIPQADGSGAEGGIAGGGGTAPGSPGGGGAPWAHREAVRLYFERP